MTDPPKWPVRRVTAAPGSDLEQLSRSIQERTPLAGEGLRQGADGPDGRPLHLKQGGPGFETVVYDPVRRPPNLPSWFSEDDLEPTLQAHFDNTTPYEWGDPFNDFGVAGGYCAGGLFYVQIYSEMSGTIDCRFPSMDGQCLTKLAIVPVGSEQVGWHCAEADRAQFEALVRVAVGPSGAGAAPLPQELTESCAPGTLQAVSVIDAAGRAIIGTAAVCPQGSRVIVAVHPPSPSGSTALVQIVGTRKGTPNPWPTTDIATAKANAAFYWRHTHFTRE